jgi:hypothetical protein
MREAVGKGLAHPFGRSKRFLLSGTIVPVDEADEADEEESFGEVGLKLARSS